MKNCFFFPFLVCVMLMLTTTGCEPDAALPADENANPQTHAEQQLQALKDFHALVVNRDGGGFDFRSSTTYTATEAKQNIEALANVSFSRGMTDAAVVSTQRDSFLVPITNGEIDGDDVVDGYFAAHARLLAHYESITDPNKQVLATVLQVGAVEAGDLKFYIRTEIGEGSSASVTGDCASTFSATYALEDAVNNFPVCTDESSRATFKLDQELKAVIRQGAEYITESPRFIGWIGTEVVALYDPGNPNNPFGFLDFIQYPNPDDDIQDGALDYLIYEYDYLSDNGLQCLSADEMNYYLCNYISLCYGEFAPAGKQLRSASVILTNGGCTCDIYYHHLQRTWAIPVYETCSGMIISHL